MVDGLQNKKIAFIIQARMQSTRLPGKILMPMPLGSDVSLLGRIILSLKNATSNGLIYIATSENKENDVLEKVANDYQIKCFRGAENDVLSRFISIITENDFDVVVRLTADNPILDIELLDKIIEQHIVSNNDYTNTTGLPIGMNFEIIKASALLSLKSKKLSDEDKEHVTLYLKSSKEYCGVSIVLFPEEKYKKTRTTVDYPSDYLTASALYSMQLDTKIPGGILLIDFALEQHPYLFEVNQGNYQKGNYTNLEQEIEAAKPILELLEFKKILSLLQEKVKV
jgi:spore coat polysaccharide biosynthesis protein SpsF